MPMRCYFRKNISSQFQPLPFNSTISWLTQSYKDFFLREKSTRNEFNIDEERVGTKLNISLNGVHWVRSDATDCLNLFSFFFKNVAILFEWTWNFVIFFTANALLVSFSIFNLFSLKRWNQFHVDKNVI